MSWFIFRFNSEMLEMIATAQGFASGVRIVIWDLGFNREQISNVSCIKKSIKYFDFDFIR